MKTILHTEWTVGDVCKGFVYNELEDWGLWNSASGVAQPVVNGKRLYKRLLIKQKGEGGL